MRGDIGFCIGPRTDFLKNLKDKHNRAATIRFYRVLSKAPIIILFVGANLIMGGTYELCEP
jgi:hypothetical protein